MTTEVRRRLGDVLLERGVLDEDQLATALAEQKRVHRPLGEILVSLGFAQPEDVAAFMAENLGLELVRARDVQPDPILVAGLDAAFVRAAGAFPLRVEGGVLHIVMAHPADPEKLERVRERYPYPLKVQVITEKDLSRMLREHLAGTSGHLSQLLQRTAGAAPTAADFPIDTVVDAVLEDGILLGATDVHVEPEERITRLRYRIDGVLHQGETLPREITDAIISRVKVLARLDIAERRRPQDGRMQVTLDGRTVDMRVSVMPCKHGENLVLRILDRAAGGLKLSELGIDPGTAVRLERVCGRPHGLMLVTGPTGSGKTTTLYAMLGCIDALHRNVATIEDPVEYEVPLVRQSQVNLSAGFGFPEGLRALLRQDPDVILVGEIRDGVTADMAMKAAMTGHLVLSTLHTNSSIGSVSRLINMGVPSYVVEECLIGVLAQRLVRRVCDACGKDVEASPEELRWLGGTDGPLRRGKGCSACHGEGLAGRSVISELFLPDDATARAIARGAEAQEILELARAAGFEDMLVDARRKVREGVSTMDEVLRTCRGLRFEEEERAAV